MKKLSKNMEEALAAVEREGHIDVTYWGSSVFSMSVRGNDRTLKALVKRGLLNRTHLNRSTYRYTLKV